jgi:hypothetical protein
LGEIYKVPEREQTIVITTRPVEKKGKFNQNQKNRIDPSTIIYNYDGNGKKDEINQKSNSTFEFLVCLLYLDSYLYTI